MAATTSIDPEQPSTNGTGNRPGELPKTLTGISGLDEVTGGGLPRGRSTLVCGPAGCGKTLLAMEFLVRGITQFDEPGVFVAFEESVEDLTPTSPRWGSTSPSSKPTGSSWSITSPWSAGRCEETGDWDLDGLFLRLGAAIDAVGAKRVVIDTIETLFGAFSNTAILRSELRRLFGWLKDRGVTSVITGERGDGTLTRHGIEEYVSDCVIVLDHRVTEQTSTRRLRILKYRGSLHGTNEYPFLIGEIGCLGAADHLARSPPQRVGGAGVDGRRPSRRDARRRRLLSRGARFSSAALPARASRRWRRSSATRPAAAGERALYFAFEESEAEIVRNMSSVGIDLRRWVDAGLLQFQCFRPSLLGLEAHLFAMQKFGRRVRSRRGRHGPDLRPRWPSERARTCRRC